MNSTLKQVYASIFIDENELQILVSEFYNTRFNVLRVDKVKMDAIHNFQITDYDRFVEIIAKSIEYTSKKVGATIKKVILVLPAYNFKRVPLRVSVIPNGGILTKKDIAKAVSSALRTKIDSNSIVVNANIIKYVINGIASRRMPEKEICDEALVDIDLLCADKQMAIDYVKATQDAGLEILDITLNNYSICKEAVLQENSLNRNIILLDIGNEHTYLSLLTKGKLNTSEIIYDGLNSIINYVYMSLGIPKENISRLIKYNVDYNSEHKDDAVFAWGSDDNNHSITIKELSDAVKEPLNIYLDKILMMCKPILDADNTTFIIAGEGAKMKTLVDELAYKSNSEVKAYYPETIGIRDSSLCALFGSLFVYKEKAQINSLNVSCLDIAEYDKLVDLRIQDDESESITNKIKKLFENYREKENDHDN